MNKKDNRSDENFLNDCLNPLPLYYTKNIRGNYGSHVDMRDVLRLNHGLVISDIEMTKSSFGRATDTAKRLCRKPR